MTDKYQDLLLEWCDALIAAQIRDKKEEYYGGFRCDCCGFPHGRADNAVYPFVCAYVLTGDRKYTDAADAVLAFRDKLTLSTGAVVNDLTSPWKGITAFSAIGLLKTLLYYGDKIPASLKEKIEKCAVSAAGWVYENMVVGFPAYVNYYCAASLVNALYDAYYHDAEHAARAKELLRYCLGLFTENGLLYGEGKPHDDRSPRGCLPIDIGYLAEESMPCLVHAAELLGEESALSVLASHALKQLDFFLPDGGWDNSFGVRNNKWTYYGSRTSDGCIGVFSALARRDDVFAEAAERTFRILRACTHDGLLYGGMRYYENEQRPCIHHTFCHAGALADALHVGIHERTEMRLPCDEKAVGYKYYPEIDTYKIRAGRYLATLTAYDYATHHYANGAAHAGGGTLSLLYKQGVGAVIAGSVYEYRMTEPNNMQAPIGKKRHSSLLVRAEYEKDGVRYATCTDRAPVVDVRTDGDVVTAKVRARFLSVEGRAENESLCAEFEYVFASDGVTISVSKVGENVRFVLPVIEKTCEVFTPDECRCEPIFFLTGGFSAEEYTFSLVEAITVTIR